MSDSADHMTVPRHDTSEPRAASARAPQSPTFSDADAAELDREAARHLEHEADEERHKADDER